MRHLIEYIDAPCLFGCKIYEWRQNAFQVKKRNLPGDLFTEKNSSLCTRSILLREGERIGDGREEQKLPISNSSHPPRNPEGSEAIQEKILVWSFNTMIILTVFKL